MFDASTKGTPKRAGHAASPTCPRPFQMGSTVNDPNHVMPPRAPGRNASTSSLEGYQEIFLSEIRNKYNSDDNNMNLNVLYIFILI